MIKGTRIFSLLSFLFALLPCIVWGWTIIVDCENGEIGDKVGQKAFEAFSKTRYSNAEVVSGEQSCEMGVTKGKTAFGEWGGIVYHSNKLFKGDEIWVHIKTFFPVDFNYNANPWLKFLRVHTGSPTQSNNGYNDWYIYNKGSNTPFRFIYEGEQVWSSISGTDDAIIEGRWETYEMYLKLDNVSVDNGGQARVRAWKNGKLMADITERKTLKYADSWANTTYIFTYWNGGAPATQTMYVDDIIVTSDTPSNRDANGNPMISSVSDSPPAPQGLRIKRK